jgi:Na+/H+ antiporter NhaB
MHDAAAVAALVTAALNAVAAAFGAWRWWSVAPSRAFWVLARIGQAAAIALAIVAGVLAALGFRPADGLFWLYALLPVAVAFVAEQFRVASAQTVLDARDLDDAEAVGRLDDADQRSVVLAILRREMGVVAMSAGVVAFLALRAYGTA